MATASKVIYNISLHVDHTTYNYYSNNHMKCQTQICIHHQPQTAPKMLLGYLMIVHEA